MGRLLRGVDDVVAVRGDQPCGLDEKGDVEEQLGERGPRAYASHREAEAAPMPQAGNLHGPALGIGEQIDAMAHRGQGSQHREHGERRAPHLEEGLRSEEKNAQGRP